VPLASAAQTSAQLAETRVVKSHVQHIATNREKNPRITHSKRATNPDPRSAYATVDDMARRRLLTRRSRRDRSWETSTAFSSR
jgi:hypothetical protein